MSTNIFDEHRAAEALIDAATWYGHDVNVGSAEDAQENAGEASIGRACPALLGARVPRYCMCSDGEHLLVPGRPVEAGDRVFGAVGKCLTYVGHV